MDLTVDYAHKLGNVDIFKKAPCHNMLAAYKVKAA